MTLEVRLTDEAERDIEAIGNWIAEESPKRAERFVDELLEKCMDLGEMPERFARVSRFPAIRRRVHGNYLIFYRVNADDVDVIRVLHGAMDYENLLWPEERPMN